MEKNREQRKEILIVPIGKVLVDILSEIAVALRKTYKYHVHIGRSEEPGMDMYDDERRQFNAERLASLAAMRKRESLVAVLGVVDGDMFIGEKSFSFGMAKPGKGIAVVALSRLREEFYKKHSNHELFLRRAVTESLFQVGMALGLQPCIMKKCVLLPTTTLWRLDEKVQTFCDVCQGRVEKLLSPEKPATRKRGAAEDNDDPSTEGPDSQELVNDSGSSSRSEKSLEDENEVAADMMEPENPPSAEEAAMHMESSEPEEPLDADMKSPDA